MTIPTFAIDVKNLTKSFDGKVVVNKLNLRVKKGDVFGFLGPNGSGKTTTIRMLCGLLTPDSGTGQCLGFDILTQSEQIKARVGYMTQRFSFYTDLSVEENLFFIARVYQLSSMNSRVNEIMERMGLLSRRKQLAGALSGGWKQRLALAASLLHEPELLLLDEPTAGVDPLARREFWDNIHHLSEEGITTLVSTHYMDEAERCTQLAYLAFGQLVVTGSLQDVISATHLLGWQVTGNISTELLRKIQSLPGVMQAAFFGNKIHVCGLDEALIDQELDALTETYPVAIKRIEVSLEDAFISLVQQSTGGQGNVI